jgi:retinol dehydrogenase 12
VELARGGYSVVMLCRDLEAATGLCAEIVAEVPGAAVRAIHCDLACLRSVRRCAETVRAEFDRIALLINNAGMVSSRRRMSAEGYELTFATNHLGHFLLVKLLLDRIAARGRIITVASKAHFRARWDLERMVRPSPGGYNAIRAYGCSKLANVMFTFALARRLAGTGIKANCLHPGVVATHLLPTWLRAVKPLITPVMFDADRGARTTLYLALSDEIGQRSGCYFDEYQQVQAASTLARDRALQEMLWSESERWTAEME